MLQLKPHTPVVFLSVYMFIVAVLALIRTGSYVPLLIAGSFALVTLVVGLLASRSGHVAVNIAIGWVVLVFLVEAFMTFNTARVHGATRPGGQYIFGSVAMLSLIALLLMILARRRAGRKKSREEESGRK